MSLINSVGRFINAANLKADALTAGIKGALCLPSIIAGLPDLGKGLIGSVASQLTRTLAATVDTVAGIVTNTINGAVAEITGAIAGVVDSAQRAYDQFVNSIVEAYEFAKSVRDKAKDVGEFISEKENCNFAAANLINCITAQALGSVSTKSAIDISKGLKPVSDFASDVASEIASVGGAIDKAVKKQSDEVDRATRVIQKQDIF